MGALSCDGEASSMDRTQLKVEIKQWEKQFMATFGHQPAKEDIKKDLHIASKYKLYNSLKTQSLTPVKPREAHLQTPQKTSPVMVHRSPQVDQLGPTPQMNGKVLSIFDASIKSAVVTPVKRTTPVKDLSGLLQQEREMFKTPQKCVRTLTFDTPSYLKSNAMSTDMTGSPSPFAPPKLKKGLSTLMEELKDIQDELKYGDFEDDLLPLSSSSEEEQEEQEEQEDAQPRWKKKGAKRQVRLVKKRARPMTEQEDLMKNKNVQEEINRLASLNNEVLHSDDSEEWPEGEKEYVRQEFTHDDPTKKRKRPLNNNFKKYKLKNNKNTNRFFGKRMKGW